MKGPADAQNPKENTNELQSLLSQYNNHLRNYLSENTKYLDNLKKKYESTNIRIKNKTISQ